MQTPLTSRWGFCYYKGTINERSTKKKNQKKQIIFANPIDISVGFLLL
nr:MAG TPA: hypothetical protein [Caudoviricetes sp.]